MNCNNVQCLVSWHLCPTVETTIRAHQRNLKKKGLKESKNIPLNLGTDGVWSLETLEEFSSRL